MSKFNQKASTVAKTARMPNAKNLAGGNGFARSDAKKELVSIVMASMLKGDQFYQSENEAVKNINRLVDTVLREDPEFVGKLMVYVRNEGNLRSVSHLLAAILAAKAKGHEFVRKALRTAFVRPDDMTETLALYKARMGAEAAIPNALRRAFKDSLESGKWGAFQYRRYAGNSKAVKLKDIVKLSHPAGNHKLFKQVIEDTLPVIDTMETNLAAGGNAAKSMVALLREGKLGYMAALKNIRSALKAGLDAEGIALWCDFIANREGIAATRVLPFRVYDAWTAVKSENHGSYTLDAFTLKKIRGALETAFESAAKNIEIVEEGERVAVILDESGSMSGMPFKWGSVLAAAIVSKLNPDNTVFYMFAHTNREVSVPRGGIFEWLDGINANGGGTHFDQPFKALIKSKTAVDKVIVLTDMQLYSGGGNAYGSPSAVSLETYLTQLETVTKHKVKALLFWNLNNYGGATPLRMTGRISELSGPSDKLLSMAATIMDDNDALVEAVEAVRFDD